MVLLVDPGCGHDAPHRVGIVDEVLPECLTRAKLDLFRQVSYLGSPEQPDGQRTPNLALHVGHAPQPWRARVTSAIAICSSFVARSALGAYLRPPLRSQVF